MKVGQVFGLILFGLGIALSVGAFVQIESGSVMKLFLGGPALTGFGLAFFFFPGESKKADSSNDKIDDSGAPIFHKIAWVIGGIAGFIIGEYYLDFFGFFS